MTAQIARARRPAVPAEHDEQVNLMQWARLAVCQYPELRLLYAIPNGGMRNVVVARKLKAEGVRSGVPDLCLPVPRGPFCGMYIELKRRKGGVVSDEQREWLTQLHAQRYHAVVCHGWEMARVMLVDYLRSS